MTSESSNGIDLYTRRARVIGMARARQTCRQRKAYHSDNRITSVLPFLFYCFMQRYYYAAVLFPVDWIDVLRYSFGNRFQLISASAIGYGQTRK